MSRIPDCRAEGPYNQNNLKDWRKAVVDGYDIAVEQMTNMLYNLEVYPELSDILDPNKAVVNIDKTEVLKDALTDWMEMQRNELITDLIEGQDND